MKVRIVLVRPRNPNNIGAAARAMANFGLEDLVVVDPYEPVWRETVAAVGGERVMNAARKMRLDEAVDGCGVIVGTTTARRRRIDRKLLSLPELPAFLQARLGSARGAAILFGSEKTGLPRGALERCAAWLRVPTAPESPSLNLGQAVAVVAYELSRAGAKR